MTLFLSARGRIGPRTFLFGGGALIVVGIALALLPVVGMALSLALFWPWWSLSAKRLHDMGRSARPAALLLGANLVLGASAGLLTLLSTQGVMAMVLLPVLGIIGLLSMVVMLASLAFLVWLALSPSDEANAYGPRPVDSGFAALIS
jgi:uncharacterized membrane protein YhaH (DUF805 family)